jgi:hypothetical protein
MEDDHTASPGARIVEGKCKSDFPVLLPEQREDFSQRMTISTKYWFCR